MIDKPDRIERVARAIATAFCGGVCPDTITILSHPGFVHVAGGVFAVVPEHGQPLWTWFDGAAREAIRVADETRGEGT